MTKMNLNSYLGLLFLFVVGQTVADHSIPAGSNSYNVPVSSSYSAVSSNSAPSSFYTVGSSSSISTGNSYSSSAGAAAAPAVSYSSPSTSYSSSSSSVISVPSSSSSYSAPTSGSSSYSAPASSSSSYAAPVSSSYSSSSSSGSSSSYSAPATGGSSYSAPASSSGSSSYAAPASSYSAGSAAASSYEAPSSSYGAPAPASTGNLYYYYYPVAAQPITHKPAYQPDNGDKDFSPLLFLLVPLIILLAAIPLLGLLGINNGRSFTGRNSELDAKFGSFGELQSEVDNLLQKYIDALDSEQCMDRVVCELGTRAQNIPSKKLFFSLVEWLAPKHLLLGKERIAIFKKAANNLDYTLETCKMFVCNPPKEITHPVLPNPTSNTSTSSTTSTSKPSDNAA